jgi:ABC-type transport system substrate-binding protein
VEKAKALLAEAGYPGGQGLPPLDYLTNETQGFRRILDRLTSDLAAIGVTMKAREMDFGAFLSELSAEGGPRAPLWRMTWFADWPDPDNFLGVQFATGAAGNFGRYSNPAFDDLVARARRETDPAARAELFRQADRFLIDDTALVPIYWYGNDVLLRPEFTGWKLSPLGPFAIAWEEVSVTRGGTAG